MMNPPNYLPPTGKAIWRDVTSSRPWLDRADYFCVEACVLLMLNGATDAAAVIEFELGWRPR